MKTDPVTLEIIRNAVQSIAEEMSAVLIYTAFSPNIRDRHDCSAAVFTTKGELVAQTEQIPLFLGTMSFMVKKVLELFPMDKLLPGDAIISNDPYYYGSHLPDICLITPVFLGDTPLAIVANIAHHADWGGSVPGSMSTNTTDIFQEGVRIPPLRICKAGVINEEALNLLAFNVRNSTVFHGDFKAQQAANQIGVKRLLQLEHKTGLDRLEFNMAEIINYSERRLLASLADVTAGQYIYTDYLEGDGISDHPLEINLCLDLTKDRITADFTGSSPQAKGPVNATPGITGACVLFAVKAALDPELPFNDGIARVVKVVSPEGTLLNPAFPAPVAHAAINTAQRITDTVLGALAQALPHRITAAGTGSMNSLSIGGLQGQQEYFSLFETCGGGQGAKSNQDGLDGVHVNMAGAMNTPVEIIETTYPLRVDQYALLPDTGGPGKFRGGAGLTRQVTLLTDAYVSVSSERNSIHPWGLAGGLPGETAKCFIEEAGGARIRVSGKLTKELPSDTKIILETAGGGGYGPPGERTREAVEQDLAEGLISTAAAREFYGWNETIGIERLTKHSLDNLQDRAANVATLADEIWREYYPPITGMEQVDYMLAKFQSAEQIYKDIRENDYTYFVARDIEKDGSAGYCATVPKEDYLLLSKLYVRRGYRSKGIGRILFDEAAALCRREYSFKRIRLTVNKQNVSSIDVYKKIGFTVVEAAMTDIGGGFYMDDYIMEYLLPL